MNLILIRLTLFLLKSVRALRAIFDKNSVFSLFSLLGCKLSYKKKSFFWIIDDKE